MHHLSSEDFARLVDEQPSASEAAHLRDCAGCAAELSAMREQTALLSSLPDLPVPPRLRTAVESALAHEGLIGGKERPWFSGALARAAAVAAVFVAGSLAGTFGIAPALDRSAVREAAPRPVTVAEAAADLEAAEARYLAAVTRYAELAGAVEGADPLNRLVALEGIVLTTEAALREAPADPVINNFHLTAVGQRDALLQRIESVTHEGDEWF